MKYTEARLGSEIHARLATILREGTGDPRLELLSITEVKVAKDASFARVFYRTLGDREEAVAALEKAKAYLRHRLASELKVRRVPELDFRQDDSIDRAERLDTVLRELEVERKAKADKAKEGEGTP
jgi:ribosome-binding factor A